MLQSIHSAFLLILLFLNGIQCHEGHDHSMIPNEDGTLPDVKRSPAVVFHAVSMSIIVFICFPFGYFQILRRNYFSHKVIQSINVVLILMIGSYATCSFSDGSSFHAVFGRIICWILIPIQIILPMIKYLPSISSMFHGFNQSSSSSISISFALSKRPWLRFIHRNLGIFLMVFAFPTQWYFGITHVTEKNAGSSAALHTRWAHYLPGMALIGSGLCFIWTQGMEIKRFMKMEIIGMALPSFVVLLGVPATHDDLNHLNHHVWDHMTIASVALFCCFLSSSFFGLNLAPNQHKWFHAVMMALFSFVMGFSMISHQHGNAMIVGKMAMSSLHKLHGQSMCFAVLTRIAMCCSPKMQSVHGATWILSGVLFLFSNPEISAFWELRLKYPPNPYLIITFVLGVYVAMINLILNETYVSNQRSDQLDAEKENEERVPLIETETNPNLCDRNEFEGGLV